MNDVETRTVGTPNFDLEDEPQEQALPARYVEHDDGGPRQAPLREVRSAGTQPQIDVERVVVRWSKNKDGSDNVDQLFGSMSQAAAEEGYGEIEKTKEAKVRSRKGEESSYTYDYETLADVIAATRPHLAKHGLACMQFPFPGARAITIRTMITHKSGQWLYNDLSALIQMPDPQAVGGGITYLRRYAMKSILNVAADDEDDDMNSQRSQPVRPAQRRSEQEQRPVQATAPQPRPAAPKQEQAQPQAAPQPAALPSNVGVIEKAEERGTVMRVKLTTGYICSVSDNNLKTVIRTYEKNGARVELVCRASSDPTKYLPILEEVIQQRG